MEDVACNLPANTSKQKSKHHNKRSLSFTTHHDITIIIITLNSIIRQK